MPTMEDDTDLAQEGGYPDPVQPKQPLKTVRQAIKDRGREAVKAEFVQIVRNAVEATGLPEEEALRADMDGLVTRIGDAVVGRFPGEFR